MPSKLDKMRLPRELDKRVKVTVSQREEMRKLYREGWTQQEIADKYGVSRTTVVYIVSQKANKELRKESNRKYRETHPTKRRTNEEQNVYARELRERKREYFGQKTEVVGEL